jgi:hypothetical protein
VRRIIYDAKNHKAWRTDFVTKLRADKARHEAAAAVLVTCGWGPRTASLRDAARVRRRGQDQSWRETGCGGVGFAKEQIIARPQCR